MNSDLQNLALRYALGELTDAESAAFEHRLETDQSARELLADAVLLTSAIRQLPTAMAVTAPADPLTVRPETARRSRMVMMIVCAAACLMLAVLIGLPERQRAIAHRHGTEASAIVGTWSDLGDDDPVFSDIDSDVTGDDGSSDIPDWMVAAVLDDMDPTPRKEGTL